MTLDLVVTLCCIFLVIGFCIGMLMSHQASEKIREADEKHIAFLKDLIKRHVGRREDDYHNIG